MSNRIITSALICMAVANASAYDALKVEIENTLSFPRHETVEIPIADIENPKAGFFVTDINGNPVSWQYTHDGKLLILADIEASSKATYRIIQPGTLSNGQTVTFSQTRPDCQDDIAWENDRCGYRLYGPSFRAGGGNVHGYDIWSKSVEYPLLAKLYHDDKVNGITYHKDHGEGFDGYTVGPTLGAGMDAIITDDSIHYPTAYEKVEIIENGPIRTSFRLTCYPENINGISVTESRMITLDAGSPVNRCDISFDHVPDKALIATGIVIHADNPDGYDIDIKNGIIAVADLTDNLADNNGIIHIGLFSKKTGNPSVRKFDKTVANAIGEVMLRFPLGDYPFTYYWGADWSRHGIESGADWMERLRKAKKCIENPMKISVVHEKK